jgi:hypothetical protein
VHRSIVFSFFRCDVSNPYLLPTLFETFFSICERKYTDERGLNSAQIISFLRIGSFMTGNSSYDDATEYLKEVHGYGRSAMAGRYILLACLSAHFQFSF